MPGRLTMRRRACGPNFWRKEEMGLHIIQAGAPANGTPRAATAFENARARLILIQEVLLDATR